MSATQSLIGRQTESAQLSRLLTEDTEHAVVIRGEAGKGKTTLIRQLSKHWNKCWDSVHGATRSKVGWRRGSMR